MAYWRILWFKTNKMVSMGVSNKWNLFLTAHFFRLIWTSCQASTWEGNLSFENYKEKKISTKTYFMGPQKNSLSETVLLSTQNICKKIIAILPSKCLFNPYKPRVLFVGHRPTVHTQIRRCRINHKKKNKSDLLQKATNPPFPFFISIYSKTCVKTTTQK